MFFSFASQSGHVELDGEGAREFIVGLADNIGLDNIRAARIVAAAVAARTRSWLLQAWVGSSILYLGFFDDYVFFLHLLQSITIFIAFWKGIYVEVLN